MPLTLNNMFNFTLPTTNGREVSKINTFAAL